MTTDVVGKFGPDLIPLLVPISNQDEDPENARLHGDANLEAIRYSLSTFGQVTPIVIWTPPDGPRPVVIKGNGTFRSIKSLGWTHVAAVRFAGPVAAARAYALADNRASELAQWDVGRVSMQLGEISRTWQDEIPWKPADLGFTVAGGEAVRWVYEAPEPRKARAKPAQAESPPAVPKSAPQAESYPVVVHCRSHAERTQMINTLSGHGIRCQAADIDPS